MSESQPFVFDASTFGRNVLLGELYDQRSEKFLGVQLYSQNSIKEVVTSVPHTDLTLSFLLNTYQQKAALLDINRQLSLQALAGLVRAVGSATYLNDCKANTHDTAFTLALKTRLTEKRLLFTEPELGRNVLEVVSQDYIATHIATHFVSSVVYGGNIVVNLIVRRQKLSEGDIVEGKLEAALEKLKDSISLGGRIKGQFANLDDKFDLVIHSDVAVEKPIDPKDLLDTFLAAASDIRGSGGVPIWVTLQPIPPSLSAGNPVYPLDADIVDILLTVFSTLDDFRGRSSVLQDGAKRLQDLVPQLFQTVRAVTAAFTRDHSELLNKLAKVLLEYQNGKKPDHAQILEKATELHTLHGNLDLKDPNISEQYPTSLAGLSIELARLQDFIISLQREGKQLQIAGRSFHYCSIGNIVQATEIQRKISLFITTSLSVGGVVDRNVVRKYFALIRKHAKFFPNTDKHPYLFYAEDPANLERRLPNNGKFSELKAPALFVGNVDDGGDLTWALVSQE